MSRDWQEDKELAHTARYEYKLSHLNPVLDALFYWLEEAKGLCEVNQQSQREILSLRIRLSAEEERADEAEEREEELKCAIAYVMENNLLYDAVYAYEHFEEILDSLYPKEETKP